MEPNSNKSTSGKVALVLVISLFFLWALTGNLLPSLIPHLKKACQLNDFQSAFIDSAYWIAYFFVAIPAAIVMRRTSYKTGIITGLVLAAVGAICFYPAADARSFGMFLGALFLIAAGMTFLETAANPYISILGDEKTSAQRLNFAQAFNGLGAFVAAFFLSKIVLSGTEYTEEQMGVLAANGTLQQYLASEADRVKIPYLVIAGILLFVATLFYFTKLPDVKEEKDFSFKLDFSVFKMPHFRNGVIAQFFYTGAQTCISSFFIRYCRYSADIREIEATNFLGYLLLCFMIGRYVGTFLMQKIAPHKLLAVYSAMNVLLLIYIVSVGGRIGVYAFLGVEFFMSIMFPTIFALGIKNLGLHTKMASSYMVMSIVGGALIPLALGYISKEVNIQVAYIVPMICFIFIFYYGWKGYKIKGHLPEPARAELQTLKNV